MTNEFDGKAAQREGALLDPNANPLVLINAVHRGKPQRLRELIAAGADVNARDDEGMTALHHAAARRARPCLRVLVNSGKCDYLMRDNKGRYAYQLAIEWARDPAVARLLMKKQTRQAHERGVPSWQKPGVGQ